MNKKNKTLIIIILLLLSLSISGCAPGNVSVGVGVYAPGAWVGPYGGYGVITHLLEWVFQFINLQKIWKQIVHSKIYHFINNKKPFIFKGLLNFN